MTIVDSKGNLVYAFPNRAESERLLSKYLELVIAIDPIMNEVPDCCKHQINDMYTARNNMVEYCVVLAKQCGYKAGFAVHQPISQLMPTIQIDYEHDDIGDTKVSTKEVAPPEWDVRWGVVAYIELLTGQIRWHLDSGDSTWDNHDNDTKRVRVKEFIDSIGGN